MKKFLLGAALVAAAAVVLFLLFKRNSDEPKFRTEVIGLGDLVMAVTATGTVNPVTNVLVGTQVSGTVKEIYVDFNSPVKKGQVIALIDPATFEAQVEQARANLQSGRANLEKAEASLADAVRTQKRNAELFSKNLIARSELDTAETNYETAKAQVSAARAQVSQGDAALKFAETNLRYTTILSPVDGVVISRNVDVGQTVAASFQTPTLFTIAQDLTKMQIDTNVDEADIGKVREGQDVEFSVDAYADSTFKGKVWQIRNAPITVQNVVTYDVVIKVENPELKLKPGMTTNVSIIIATKKDVLRVPNAALRVKLFEKVKPGPDKRGSGVWVLDKGEPKRITVAAGISDGTFTEVISGDLKEGQEVVVESLKPRDQTAPQRPLRFP